jgi:hypothetical protein
MGAEECENPATSGTGDDCEDPWVVEETVQPFECIIED